MIAIIILTVLLYLAQRYNPEVEYISESEMWVMFYNSKNTRKYKILWKRS